MNKKKYLYSILIIIITSLIGYFSIARISFVDENGIELHKRILTPRFFRTNLPIVSKKDHVFIGWRQNNNLFLDHFNPINNDALVAQFVPFEDVFIFEIQGEVLTLANYKSDFEYMVVPEYYQEYLVARTSSGLFEGSKLRGVYLPNSLNLLSSRLFAETKYLENLNFYGEYQGTLRRNTVSESYLNDILSDYSNECGSEILIGFEYGNECPIVRIIRQTTPVIVDNIKFVSYIAEFNMSFESVNANWIWGQEIFYNSSIKEVNLPRRAQVSSYTFIGAQSLTAINLAEESLFYHSVEGVLYDLELIRLIAYPPGKTNRVFEILDTVEEINALVFKNSQNVNLEYFKTSNSNLHFSSIDGVLYDSKEEVLVVYPSGRNQTDYQTAATTKTIASYAFSSNKNLENLILNSGIQNIDYSAFFESSIKEINLPSTLLQIGLYTFSRTENLTVKIEFNELPNIYYPIFDNNPNNLTFLVTPKLFNHLKENPNWDNVIIFIYDN